MTEKMHLTYISRSFPGIQTIRLRILFVLAILFAAKPLLAQITLSGNITDEQNGEPIPFASASIVNEHTGSLSDSAGHFTFQTNISKGLIRFSATGYETRIMAFSGSHHFSIALRQSRSVLKEVTISAKRGPYHNKNNPAVALIRQVIAHKDENQLQGYDHAQYQEYEKMMLALENPAKVLRRNFISKKYAFVFKNIDTTTIIGKKLLPLFLEENIYQKYYQKSPLKRQSLLTAHKQVMLNEKYVNNGSLGTVLKYIYQDVDLYQNDIYILTNSFLSPIAPLSPQFYRFYITDTVTDHSGQKTVKLSFEPRNTHDLLFYGTLYVALNGHYSITEAKLSVTKSANINWINNLHLILKYQLNQTGKYFLQESKLAIDFGMNNLTKQGIYGERTVTVSDFNINSPIPDSIFKIAQPSGAPPDSSYHQPSEFWKANRPDSLSPVQQRVYANMDSLNRMPSFNRLISWVSFLIAGYKYAGPVEIGPWGTFYSYNPVEGLKLRFGGRTTSELSQTFYFAGNAAYGFHDQKWKYFGSAAISFNKQNIFYGYPQHYFQVSSFSDSRIPGRGFQFQDENNIFLSVKRGENNRYLYNQVFHLDYVNELIPHLRFDLQYEHWQQEAAGGLYFVADQQSGSQDTINRLVTAGFGLDIRWAPHEKFLKGRDGRTSIPSKYPVIGFGIKTGLKGFAGGEYNFQQYILSIQKRFYMSQLGYADITLQGGYMAGKVPYPLLFIPKANQSYNYQVSSFNLMNFLEFISDEYASVKVDYHLHGFLLNKVPGIQWLRLREVAGFKAIYGGLRPENASELFALPEDDQGRQATFGFDREPYMEFNIGVENILNIIRIDYVRRLNYFDHPNITKNGFRLSVNLAF